MMSRAHSTLVSGNMSDELLENDPAGLGLIALPPVFSKFDINQVIRYSEIELIAPTFATSPEPELPEVVYTSQAVGAREVQIGEVEVEEVIDDGELLGGEQIGRASCREGAAIWRAALCVGREHRYGRG